MSGQAGRGKKNKTGKVPLLFSVLRVRLRAKLGPLGRVKVDFASSLPASLVTHTQFHCSASIFPEGIIDMQKCTCSVR